ncbi:MAG: hypothetical protein ACK4XJ_03465 [Fimbriimonadaceae bacterium]
MSRKVVDFDNPDDDADELAKAAAAVQEATDLQASHAHARAAKVKKPLSPEQRRFYTALLIIGAILGLAAAIWSGVSNLGERNTGAPSIPSSE